MSDTIDRPPEEKEVFPKKFPECPNCGSLRRFSEYIVENEVKSGRSVHALGKFQPLTVGIMVDPAAQLLVAGGKVRIPGCDIDICVDCGTIYATAINIVEAKMNMQPGQPGQFPPGSSFPKFPGAPNNTGMN